MARYVDPYTDFGFKKLFGSEMNKDLLISFLNALLHKEQIITDLTYMNGEHLGTLDLDRKSVFDVYCENDRGEKFIVEMQKTNQEFFKDRSLFYSTFPIREQARQGKWNYELKSVYTIAILNFEFKDGDSDNRGYQHEVKLMDVVRKQVFYDKLTFVFLEMPKFTKTETELLTMFDKWMFLLKNLATFFERPASLQERIFEKVFRAAEIARFNRTELVQYEEDLKNTRDRYSIEQTMIKEAEEKGLEIGMQQGMQQGIQQGIQKGIEQGMEQGMEVRNLEIARSLKSRGMTVLDIVDITGLSLDQIAAL